MKKRMRESRMRQIIARWAVIRLLESALRLKENSGGITLIRPVHPRFCATEKFPGRVWRHRPHFEFESHPQFLNCFGRSEARSHPFARSLNWLLISHHGFTKSHSGSPNTSNSYSHSNLHRTS